jgi:hypothetical protein
MQVFKNKNFTKLKKPVIMLLKKHDLQLLILKKTTSFGKKQTAID